MLDDNRCWGRVANICAGNVKKIFRRHIKASSAHRLDFAGTENLNRAIALSFNDTATEIKTRRKLFLCKWRLECRAVADSLGEGRDRLFTSFASIR